MADAPYVIVPKEPTEQMCRAGEECDGSSNSGPWLDGGYKPENVELIFKTMISASPHLITLEEIVEVLTEAHRVLNHHGMCRERVRSLLSRLTDKPAGDA